MGIEHQKEVPLAAVIGSPIGQSLSPDLHNYWLVKNNLKGYYIPQMYSWLDVDDENIIRNVNVKEFKGGNPLDQYAVVGTMFFRNKDIYMGSLSNLYKKNIRTNGEFYIDNIFNTLSELDIKIFDVEKYHCWGTPEELKKYEN